MNCKTILIIILISVYGVSFAQTEINSTVYINHTFSAAGIQISSEKLSNCLNNSSTIQVTDDHSNANFLIVVKIGWKSEFHARVIDKMNFKKTKTVKETSIERLCKKIILSIEESNRQAKILPLIESNEYSSEENENTYFNKEDNIKVEVIEESDVAGLKEILRRSGPSSSTYSKAEIALLDLQYRNHDYYVHENSKIKVLYRDSTKISNEYIDIQPFHDGLAKVMNSYKKYGFIDRNGKVRIELEYDIASNFNKGRVFVRRDGIGNYILDMSGNIISTLPYNTYPFEKEKLIFETRKKKA